MRTNFRCARSMKLLLAATAAAALLAGCKSSSTPMAETRPVLEPQAQQILQQMSDTLCNAKAVRFEVEAVIEKPVITGQLAQFTRVSAVTCERPSRLRVETDGDDGQWAAWYDGQTLALVAKDNNLFATENISGTTGDMLDFMADRYGVVMPMADFLVNDVCSSLLANVKTGKYLGTEVIDGAMCHHLLFRQENIDWQIWITAQDKPLPRRLVIDYKRQPGEPEYSAMISHWDLAPAIDADTFKFTPPGQDMAVSMPELIGFKQGEQP
jgi:hypothetical protein